MQCHSCGYEIPLQDLRVKFYGMYDMHLFTSFEGSSLDEIIAAWREHNATPNPAMVGGDKVDDLGKASLCPARVIGKNPINGKSVERSVGKMVFPASDYRPQREADEELAAWREAVEADDEIMVLLATAHDGHDHD